jgi:molybdopterin molybdotransferase
LFLKVKTTEEVLEILKGFGPVGEETASIEGSLGRFLSKDILSPENLPGFYRSSMDGYAVRANDTFGATESLPALLNVAGEVIMGRSPDSTCGPGEAIKISTGGMVPKGADGVVMLEYCHLLDDRSLEVSRAISPLENIILPDDDIKKGITILSKGHHLRVQDLGLLAGLGISRVSIYRKPRVAIISTGDEIVPIDQTPVPGQVRDINSYTMSAFCRQAGADPIILGLCDDNFSHLKEMVLKGLDVADSLWISGGSSVGTRDITLKVFESFNDMELLVHGISISPGKPTIIARINGRAVFGLPGHTASAIVIGEVFLRFFLSRLSGETASKEADHFFIEAEISRNIESTSGREDYIRVKLIKKGDRFIAEPVFGKSGLISTLVEAHGLLKIDRNSEGIYEGQTVKIMLFVPYNGTSQ